MKNQYPSRTALTGLALFVLINVMPGRASADDVTTSATVQSLQRSIVQHQELLATQAKQLQQRQQQIREQSEQLRIMENQLKQLVAASGGSEEAVSQQTVATTRSVNPDDPTEMQPDTLPGYLDVPGTDLSMKIGGYVKMSIVQSFDP
ncbi:MAG: hypothetical protein WBM45_13850, partial [Woeseiaceae bacterium]